MLVRTRLAMACALVPLVAGGALAKDKWILVRSPHFVAIGNASEGRCRKTVEQLEQFRHVFSLLFSLGNEDEVPTRVMIFRNEKSFRPFQPLFEGKPRNLAGYFQKTEGANLIAINDGSVDPLHVIYHEYVHLLEGRYPRPLPVWFNEGLAEYYSSFKIKGDKAVIGDPLSTHVLYLRQRRPIPLERLLQVGHSSPEYNENDKTGVFYAESWALVHLLLLGNNGARRDRLNRYVELLGEEGDSLQAFRQAFETPLEELEKELRRYVNQRQFNIELHKLADLKATREMTVSPVSEADSQAYLGDLLLYAARLDEAPDYYNRALQLEPGNMMALEGLGWLALKNGEHEKALDLFQKIDLTKSTNFLACYRYGEALMEEAGLFFTSKKELTDEEFEKLSSPLLRSVDLSPSFAEGYYLLALLHHVSGRDPKVGVGLIRRAIRLQPQDLSYRQLLASLQIDVPDLAGARETVNGLDAFRTLEAQRFAQETRQYIDSLERQKRTLDELGRGGDPEVDAEALDAPAAPPPSTPRPAEKTETLTPKLTCYPDFVKLGGATTVTGRLLAVECGAKGVVYVGEVEGREIRFVGMDPSKPVLYSCQVDISDLRCGPVQFPAAFHLPGDLAKDPATGLNLILAIEVQREP